MEQKAEKKKFYIRRKEVLLLLILTLLFFIWGLIASISFFNKNAELVKAYKNNDRLLEQIKATKLEAENKIKEAHRIYNNAQKLIRTGEKKLQNVYGSLFRYNKGLNVVNGKYIRTIEISENNIKIKIQNNSSENIKPRFTIYLLNEYGFITGKYHREYFIFDESIKPGETRIDEGTINKSYGEPVYFSVDLEGV